MTGLEIAIVGIGCRFPGAPDPEKFWRLLSEGREAIDFYSVEDLIAIGLPAELVRDPLYVKAGGVLENIEMFDPEFFAFTREEAELTDPQQRIFLECAWEALEDAGYDSARYSGAIGVYAGAITSQYLFHLLRSGYPAAVIRSRHAIIGNENDHLSARVAYKLDLKGPAVGVQTACSTSLVAMHIACQGLLSGDCDMALAGGASVAVPQKLGYLYQEGGIESRDGHCRAFDADASGTVGGSGVGVVVLKRLADAIEDRDSIYALIIGSAINNDGSQKIGYTAPSVEGQIKAIRMAHLRADVEVDAISYIECHGTGTELGDPIEVAALTQAFRSGTNRKQYCAIGSVKTNIGHLDAAAGVAGLIKTTLALRHELIPPTLYFKSPNPRIDFESSPFYVAARPIAWKQTGKPRLAAVSSLGIGGTNAHVVMQEAPAAAPSAAVRGLPVLVLAARTPDSLRKMRAGLLGFLGSRSDICLADVAFTLQVGRRHFPHRTAVVCRDLPEAISRLGGEAFDHSFVEQKPKVAFMFPGQGAQSVNMARDLYLNYSQFRKQVDECCSILEPLLGFSLLHVLYPPPEALDLAERRLLETNVTQPAMFVIDYALAMLWMDWGIRPAAMIGHSLGEYVAACIAGVLSLKDALRAVAARGELMRQAEPGAMLAAGLSAQKIQPLLRDGLELAAVNSSSHCVVAGPIEAVDAIERKLVQHGTFVRRLRTKRAFHTAMMDSAACELVSGMKHIRLDRPAIPCISGVTGQWITDAEYMEPKYWGRQLRQTVMFSQGIESMRKSGCNVFLEVGPGAALAQFVMADLPEDGTEKVWSSIPGAPGPGNQLAALHQTLTGLWLSGAPIDWEKYHAGEGRRRVGLPTYPFERNRFWLDKRQVAANTESTRSAALTAEIARQSDAVTASFKYDGHAGDDMIEILRQQVSVMQQQLDCWAESEQ